MKAIKKVEPDVEIWDLYNENRELLGKDHIRGEQLPAGFVDSLEYFFTEVDKQ